MKTASMEYEIMIQDAGPDSLIKVKSIFNIMQTCAINHSRGIGSPLALSNIVDKNLTWVYNRFFLVIDKYARLYEKVTCETWRSKIVNNAAYREFLLADSAGEVLSRGISSVVMIDMTTRKPLALPEEINRQLNPARESVVDFRTRVDYRGELTHSEIIRTRYDDIDINGHMNNASYAQIFFENGYRLTDGGMSMKSIDIFFRGEIAYDDELECGSAFIEKPGIIYHRLFNRSRDKAAAVSVTEWL